MALFYFVFVLKTRDDENLEFTAPNLIIVNKSDGGHIKMSISKKISFCISCNVTPHLQLYRYTTVYLFYLYSTI